MIASDFGLKIYNTYKLSLILNIGKKILELKKDNLREEKPIETLLHCNES